MDKSFEDKLRKRFECSLSPISIKAKERMEVEVEVDNKKRSAEFFEAVISAEIFRLYMRIIRVNKTFFKDEELFETYEMDSLECPPFTIKEVLSLLNEAGYEVPLSIIEKGRENYAIAQTSIMRSEKGRARFFYSLRKFDIKSLRLTLEYKAEGDGCFSLHLFLNTTRLVDTGHLRYLSLGPSDYQGQVSQDKKDALIRYLVELSSFSMHAGLEIFNIVDYMSLLEKMQDEPRSRDFSFSIEKKRSAFAASHPSFGGPSYSDYGLTLTPLDFAWYLDGFCDNEDQRQLFFSYYDSVMEEGEKSEEERLLEVLGLRKGASIGDVEKAYKGIVMRFHPDRISSLGLDPSFTAFANAQMQRANEAYGALKKILTS